jgi:hypothetical protein
LIGLDFLKTYHGDVSIAQNTLFLMHGLVATSLIHQNDYNQTLTTAHNMKIPPHTEAKIPVLISHNYKPQLSIIEGNKYHINNIMVARCLVKPKFRETICQIINTSDQTVLLKKGLRIATISPIDEKDEDNQRLLNTQDRFENTEVINTLSASTDDQTPHAVKLQTLQNLGISFA